MNKILTIIIPSYNMEAYLPKCLGTLVFNDKELLQTLDIIVVNDGSEGYTSEIAHEFEKNHLSAFFTCGALSVFTRMRQVGRF